MVDIERIKVKTGGLGRIYIFHGLDKQKFYLISVICQLDIVNKRDFMNKNRKTVFRGYKFYLDVLEN